MCFPWRTHLSLTILSERGSMQLTLQLPFPTSLQIEEENRPKLARTTLMREPSSQTTLSLEPSQPYLVRRWARVGAGEAADRPVLRLVRAWNGVEERRLGLRPKAAIRERREWLKNC